MKYGKVMAATNTRGRMSRHIAIVEDDTAIRENYVDALARQGYRLSGHASRSEALKAFAAGLPDLVVIDVGLGDEPEGGFDLCRELRSRSATLPVIFLTSRDSDLDTISGLRLGADDYLTKDISLPHLSARIATLFRRLDALREPVQADKLLRRGALEVDNDRMVVHWKNEDVPLTVTEFWLVNALVRHPGHVKNRDQLMDEARVVVDGPTITSHIKRIRKKFLSLDPEFDSIETVYGMGYRWRT